MFPVLIKPALISWVIIQLVMIGRSYKAWRDVYGEGGVGTVAGDLDGDKGRDVGLF